MLKLVIGWMSSSSSSSSGSRVINEGCSYSLGIEVGDMIGLDERNFIVAEF